MFGAMLGAKFGVFRWFYTCFVRITFSEEKLPRIPCLMEVETIWIDFGTFRVPQDRSRAPQRAAKSIPQAAKSRPKSA